MRFPGGAASMAASGIFLLAAFSAAIPVGDGDVWYHLAAGRLIWEGGLPHSNAFSWTWPDFPWTDPEWGYQLLLFLLHRWGGFAAIGLFQAAAVGAAFALLWEAARLKAGSPSPLVFLGAALPPFLLALFACRFRFNHRPEILTFLFLALLLFLWERRPPRLSLWLFIAGVLWANLHPGVLFGALVCAAYTAEGLLRGGRERALAASAAPGAFLAGTLLNPYFLSPYSYLFSHLFLGRDVSLAELARPSPAGFPGFFLAAALAAAAVPLLWRRREFASLLLLGGFFPLALSFSRQVPLFMLAWFPALAAASQGARGGAEGGPARKWAWRSGAALLLAVAVGIGAWDGARRRVLSPFGLGVNHRVVPEGALALIRDRGLTGPLFNDYNLGGFLLWGAFPRVPVFIDPRTFAYPRGFLAEARAGSPDRLRDLVGRYRPDLAVVPWNPELHWAAQAQYGSWFEEMGWALVHLDGVSRVYVRPGSPDAGRTSDLVFRRVRSASTDLDLARAAGTDPEGLHGDLARIDPGALNARADFSRFGAAAAAVGDLPMAERFLGAGSSLWPSDPQLSFNLGVVLAEKGDPAGARRLFRRVAGGSPAGSPLRRRAERELSALPPAGGGAR